MILFITRTPRDALVTSSGQFRGALPNVAGIRKRGSNQIHGVLPTETKNPRYAASRKREREREKNPTWG
jgi:hypothetical protein